MPSIRQAEKYAKLWEGITSLLDFSYENKPQNILKKLKEDLSISSAPNLIWVLTDFLWLNFLLKICKNAERS